MHIVVPLAGPDFQRPDGALKPLTPIDGAPLLRRALDSRPWADRVPPECCSFVLHDSAAARGFATDCLSRWYPASRHIYLSAFTQGAAMSAAAGVVAQAGQVDGPLIVDLADILYSCPEDPLAVPWVDTGGVALTFDSDDPRYSYLRTDENGRVVEAAEKRVISRHASAGTYLFRDSAVYLRALAHALDAPDRHVHASLYFVCPLFNGVLQQDLKVRLSTVGNVQDIKVAGSA